MIDVPQDPDEQARVLRALDRLGNSDDFQVVRRWLESELSRIREANDQVEEEVHLRRGQGAALTLRYLFETQDSAREALRRSR